MELTKEQKIFGQVIQKAWEDADFKAELIASPAQAIKMATGETLDLPNGLELQVQDQSDPTKAYLVIPAQVNADEMELTDEQLEMVAGGEFVSWAVTTLIVTLIVSGGVGAALK